MTKKNIPLQFIVFVILLGFFSCSEKTIYQAKNYNEVISDSSDNIYSGMLYNSQARIFYTFSNNDSTLLLKLCVADQATQMKIMMFGLSVWLDTTNKKKSICGIKYPIPKRELMQTPPPNTRSNPGMMDQNKKKMMAENLHQAAVIIDGKEVDILDSRFSDQINTKISFTEMDIMIYKISFKFSLFNLDFNKLKNNFLSLGIESGHLDPSQMQMGNRPPGGTGMKPPSASGGVRQGGGHGGNPPDQSKMQEMMEASKFYVKNIMLYQTK